MTDSRNRRALPRMMTAVRIDARDGGPYLIAHDLSLGGMMVTTAQPRWPGTLLPVRFTLPGQTRAICATCRVVDLIEVPHGIGLSLRFLRLAPEAQTAVARYVDERPLPDFEHLPIAARVSSWLDRIVEDCKQLGALARTDYV